ncbi:hypothetical protein B0H14DRAFT_3453463 [Mycena olivaceomarginata]|nr:hypothetical protein B0H14DRAFT_3453463 [Mycena olivaceomarginata]
MCAITKADNVASSYVGALQPAFDAKTIEGYQRGFISTHPFTTGTAVKNAVEEPDGTGPLPVAGIPSNRRDGHGAQP